jgi:chemotaxis protein CheZ
MQKKRKPFTIELQRGLAESPAAPSAAQPQANLGDIMRTLDELRSMLQPSQAIIANIAEAYRREVQDVMKLREELDGIQHAIQETKRHVVAFHASTSHTVTVNHAAGELGAVVVDTESATNAILAAAERIEMLAGVIQSEKTTQAMKQRAGEIASMVMSIYEACNFQDLTGQRITRVCDTLGFVEERVGRMTEIWGGLDSLSHVMAQEMENLANKQEALGTHALAAGPALVGSDGHVGQDDIDALFD